MESNIKTAGAGWMALFAAENRLRAIALSLGVLLHVINVYLSTTVMPSIVKEIGGLAWYAWNTTVFVVASIIGSVVSAHLMALNGPRKSYRIAILMFAAGTVICITSSTMFMMLTGRFVQGLGGGLLCALSYAMIRIIFDQPLWARAMALVSGMWGIGAFLGPFIGGLFAEYDQWRMAFVSILFISIVLMLITEKILPKTQSESSHSAVPWLKLLLLAGAALSVSIASVLNGMIAQIIGVLTGLIFLVLLVLSEKGSRQRLLPTGAYKLSNPIGATYAVMVLFAFVAVIEIFVPYFAQTIYHFSPLGAGYLTVLIALGWTAGSLSMAGMKTKYFSLLLIAGALCSGGGLTVMAILSSVEPFSGSLLLTCIFLLLTGLGIGICWPHLLVRVFSLAEPEEAALTSSSVTTVQLLAMALGAAVGGLIANAGGITHPGGTAGAKSASILVYGCYVIAPALILLLVLFSKNFRKN